MKARLENDGQLFVYLESPEVEAGRLTFLLSGVSAAREDGGSIPLDLLAAEMSGKGGKGDRLLASGVLPPGQYAGLSFLVKNASLKGEEGVSSLSVAGEMVFNPVAFRIARRKAQVISLRFRYRDSLKEGGRFAPVFSAEIPGKLPEGLIGLVSSIDGDAVTVFNKMTGKVAGVIHSGGNPAGMALDPVSRRAYVALPGDDAVEAIDLLAADVILRGRVGFGDRPEELVLTPDRRLLLTANAGSNTVSAVDTASLLETRRIEVGSGPQSILFDRSGRRAFVFNTLSSTISVLDLGSLAVTSVVNSEAGPIRGDFNRFGSRLYVLHRNSPYLSVLDAMNFSVIRRVYVGTGGTALKVDPKTDLIYLARRGGGEIAVYDPASFLPVGSYPTRQDVSHLAIDGETNSLFAAIPATGEVKAFRLAGGAEVLRIEVTEKPGWVTLMGGR